MFDYNESSWGAHPVFEELEVFSLSVPQEKFRPLGYLLGTIYDIEGEDPDSLAAAKLAQKPATIYYHPAEPQQLDLEWLASVGPGDAQMLIDWSKVALRQYVESIEGHEFGGIPDDFPTRVLESIEENQLEQRFELGEEQIVSIVQDQGVFPFLSVDEIVISQPKNLYQICCECVLDSYFDTYGFGIYRENGEVNFAAPDFAMPQL